MKTRKTPMRRCAGCMQSKAKNELIRIACYEGVISIDPSGKAKGRGTYVCRDEECLKKAIKKKAFVRAFHMDLEEDKQEQLLQEIRQHDAG